MVDLAARAADSGLFSWNLKATLLSLDPCVPHPLICRYLLLRVRKEMNAEWKLRQWLNFLSPIKGTDNVLLKMRQHYKMFDRSKIEPKGQKVPWNQKLGNKIRSYMPHKKGQNLERPQRMEINMKVVLGFPGV